jgi:hypothetical protein
MTMRSRCLLFTVMIAGLTAAAGTPRAQRAAPRLLVLNKEDANLAIVDPVSGSVLGRVPVGQGPHELVTSADGKFAFASNYGTGPAPGRTISMIDVAAQKEVRRIDVSPLSRPHGLAFANGKLFFTAEADKKIARYDPATDKIDWQFETGQATTHMVLPSKDARTLFTSNIGGDSVSAIQQGATTIWEDWEGIDEHGTPTASLNHYSKGAVVSFLHEYVAGIRLDDDGPGYRRFRVEPVPGGGITWAEAAHESPYGRIESSWWIRDGHLQLTVRVPPSCTATVRLPDGSDAHIGPGTAIFDAAIPVP